MTPEGQIEIPNGAFHLHACAKCSLCAEQWLPVPHEATGCLQVGEWMKCCSSLWGASHAVDYTQTATV